jgi:NADPH-dependent 2,4-dienoyl-CoA reductase/sulfur reductase-like enzyme/rhodanese-related sulfurtransferase
MVESNYRVVIIGGVAAGTKTACRLRRLDPSMQITLIDKGNNLSYGAYALPYFIEGLFDNLDDVRKTLAGAIRDKNFFTKVKGFDVFPATEALAIDRERREVRIKDLNNGEERILSYDSLVLATGSRPIMPPLPGMDLEGVVPLKTMEHADQIDRLAKSACSAVIIGGGLIGLDMAAALIHRGIKVTLLETKDQVMATAFDFGMAALVHRELRKNGVDLRLSEGPERIEGKGGKVTQVVTANGSYAADLVLIAIGVHPEVGLAKQAGITLGSSGAIAVDDQLRTSDERIFAAGDCAETTNLLSGRKVYIPLGSTANKHGRVVANNICGREERFPGILGSLIVKAFDLNVGRSGLSIEDAHLLGLDAVSVLVPGPDKAHVYPDAKPIVIKLVADRTNRRLLGAQIIGPGDVAKRLDVCITAMTMGMTVDQLAQLDLAYAPPFSAAMDPLHQAANTLRNKLDGLAESLDPATVKNYLEQGENILLLDVRSPAEHEEVRIPGAQLVPLGALRSRLDELPRHKPIVTFCKLSLRAYEAALILKSAGFDKVKYMEGGILGWPYDLDTGLP